MQQLEHLTSHSDQSATHLPEGFAEILREERVQEGVDATAAVRQHVRQDLHSDVQLGQLVLVHGLEQQNQLKERERRYFLFLSPSLSLWSSTWMGHQQMAKTNTTTTTSLVTRRFPFLGATLIPIRQLFKW